MEQPEPGPGGLLERDEALSSVAAALDRVLAGSGRVVVVTGPAGVGKSSILGAAAAIAGRAGFRTIFARGGELESGFPFGLTRELLGPFAANAGGHSGEARRVFDPSTPGAMGADTSHAILRGLYWIVADLADAKPVAMFVDDAHWADLATLRFVDYLSRRLDDLPVAVFLAARDTEPGSEQQLKDIRAISRAETLSLDLLSPAATARLLGETIGDVPDEQFGGAVHRTTGGNPFLVLELAHELVRRGINPDEDGVSQLSQITPRSVEAGIRAHLDRLGPACTAVAESAAVLGDGCSARLIAAMVDLAPDAVGAAVDRLVGTSVFADGSIVSFRHPLLRTAVLHSIPRGRRSSLHSTAAACLRREGADYSTVAAQLLHTEPHGDPDAAAVLRNGARESLARGSPESAVAFLERAREEIGIRHPERPHVLFELGAALGSLDPASSAEILIEAARSARDLDLQANAAAAAGRALCTAGRVREGINFVESVLAGLDYKGEASLRLLAKTSGELYWTLGQSFEEAYLAALRYWAWAEGLPEEAATVAAGRAYIECVTRGDRARAGQWATEAARDRRLIQLNGPGDYVAMAALVALVTVDELQTARSLCKRLRAEALRCGEQTALANCSMWSAWVDVCYGDLLSAEVDARTAVALARTTGQYLGVPVVTLAAVLVEQGDARKAVSLFDDFSVDIDGSLDDRQKTMTLIGRAAACVADGRFAEADRYITMVRAVDPTGGDRNPLLPWRATRAMVLNALGRDAEASEQVKENLEVARAWGAPRQLAEALRLAARSEPLAPARLQLLREAAEVAEDTQSILERGKVQVALGSELRRQGLRVESRSRLTSGHEICMHCGATGLAQFALAELVASGARPRRSRSFGPEALTASERRVAEMAAAGMSNREISEALFVSMKTVSFHLTNSYRKLGVTNRDELSRIFDPS